MPPLSPPGGEGKQRRGPLQASAGDQKPGLLGDLTKWLLTDLLRVCHKKTWAFPGPQTVQPETDLAASLSSVLSDLGLVT